MKNVLHARVPGETRPTILFTDELERGLSFIVDKIKTRKTIPECSSFVASYLKKGHLPGIPEMEFQI